MNQFNRQAAVEYRNILTMALQEVAKQHGVEITVGKCTYSDIEMDFKVIVKTKDTNAIAQKEQKLWNDMCGLYQFKVEDFGKVFASRGENYKISGLNPRKSRFALKALRLSDGKMYGFDAEAIAQRLKFIEVK